LGRSATPPEPSRSPRGNRPAGSILPATVDRRDVASVVARCLEEAAAGGPLTADCRDIVDPQLPAVDAVARVALAAARARRPFRLEHASPALVHLLRLCGLDETLLRGGPPEGDDPA
jgi:hypothetical protein